MGDHRAAHGRVPELDDVLGDLCGRRVHILRLEKLADLVGYVDFIPLFVEDYCLLGRRETIERADVEAIVASLQSQQFAEHVRGIPGYDASRTGEVSNVSDVIG